MHHSDGRQDLKPFPFRQGDLAEPKLLAGVHYTLTRFFEWRDANSARIAEHVDHYTDQAKLLASCDSSVTDRRHRIACEARYFGIYNLSEVPTPATVAEIVDAVERAIGRAPAGLEATYARQGPAGTVALLERHFPSLAGAAETRWLTERLRHLHLSLPETVVQQGGMGKVLRTIAGVLAIGAYDTLGAGTADRAAHLRRILPGAYAYGAAYAIIDDTLQDLPTYLPKQDRDRAHELILQGLSSGRPIDLDQVPDHPLAEELRMLHELLLEVYSFDDCRALYHAAHAMYRAQHRDASRNDAAAIRLVDLYPDIVAKAGLTRVIANLLGRRHMPPDSFYARCLNATFMSQFRDDLRDQVEDEEAGQLTIFTFPVGPDDTNPLYDLFAYSAYVVSEVFEGDPTALDAITRYGAMRLLTHLAGDQRRGDRLIRRYDTTPEIERFLATATNGVPERVVALLSSYDLTLKERAGRLSRQRDQLKLDARTFVLDRLEYVNDVITRHCAAPEQPDVLSSIAAYALGGPAKRLRPALTLMLAEALAVDYPGIEPLLAAGELFHAASLVFDDLPAQDNATTRRGRPAAHLVFGEGSVQISAVAMISSGFGLLAKLHDRYPARNVVALLAYIGSTLGPERLCRGQYLDLTMGETGTATPSMEEILTMYRLKTSTMLEAALVPLMVLLDRPATEIDHLKRYADHAGIVFQIRDDLLDLATTDDAGKVNLVQVYGAHEARRILESHLEQAVAACSHLSFDTGLLEGAALHFANRRG